MRTFWITIHGTGVSIDGRGPETGEKCGFYTARKLSAQDEEEAKITAIKLVEEDWTTGESSSLSPEKPPENIFVEEVVELKLWQAWRPSPKGNTIYIEPEDE